MKNKIFLFVFALFISSLAYSQIPQAINYQAVARNNDGEPVTNSNLIVRLSIISDSTDGVIVWQEGHSVNTNEFGLFNLKIGEGVSTTVGTASSFGEINWSGGQFYLNMQIDFGNGLVDMGTSKMLSVPYALFAEKSGNAGAQTLSVTGHELSISNGNTITLPDEKNDADADPFNELQSLILSGNDLSISDGNKITFPGDDDSDSTNEIQTLLLSGNDLSISNGNQISLPTSWVKSSNDIYYDNGNVSIGTDQVFNSKTKLSILDSTAKNSPALIYAYNTGSNNFFVRSRNILGIIEGITGTNEAVAGESVGSSSGTNKGLYGFAKGGIENYGVQGVAYGNSSADTNYGVYGISAGSGSTGAFNTGVYGEAKGSIFYNRGVDGRTNGVGQHNEGVFGHSIGSGSGQNIGLYGYVDSSSFVNYGALGETKGTGQWNIGMFANAYGAATTNYAFYASAINATTNYAGYFSGDVTVTGTFSNPSDVKLKTNISELYSSIEIVKKLNPVSFEFKNDFANKGLSFPQGAQRGFVAQELEKILPDLVTTQVAPIFENGDVYNSKTIEKFEFKSINYLGLIPLLTDAIQEQQNIIENQQSEINDLKEQNKLLIERLNSIEMKVDKLID